MIGTYDWVLIRLSLISPRAYKNMSFHHAIWKYKEKLDEDGCEWIRSLLGILPRIKAPEVNYAQCWSVLYLYNFIE